LSEANAATDIAAAAATALAVAEQALRDGTTDKIDDETVQKLLTAGSRLLANKIEMEERDILPFISREACTATDVVTTVSEMLRAVNLNVFDLAMWFRRSRNE